MILLHLCHCIQSIVLQLPFRLLQDTARCSTLEVAEICQSERNGGLSPRLG